MVVLPASAHGASLIVPLVSKPVVPQPAATAAPSAPPGASVPEPSIPSPSTSSATPSTGSAAPAPVSADGSRWDINPPANPPRGSTLGYLAQTDEDDPLYAQLSARLDQINALAEKGLKTLEAEDREYQALYDRYMMDPKFARPFDPSPIEPETMFSDEPAPPATNFTETSDSPCLAGDFQSINRWVEDGGEAAGCL